MEIDILLNEGTEGEKNYPLYSEDIVTLILSYNAEASEQNEALDEVVNILRTNREIVSILASSGNI